jgi:hypothetical protein
MREATNQTTSNGLEWLLEWLIKPLLKQDQTNTGTERRTRIKSGGVRAIPTFRITLRNQTNQSSVSESCFSDSCKSRYYHEVPEQQ